VYPYKEPLVFSEVPGNGIYFVVKKTGPPDSDLFLSIQPAYCKILLFNVAVNITSIPCTVCHKAKTMGNAFGEGPVALYKHLKIYGLWGLSYQIACIRVVNSVNLLR